MNKTKNRRRRARREALVHQHLERVSRKFLSLHFDVVRSFIGRNAGIYALYRRDRLYYVGLATNLSGRLKTHLRDRHGNSWDRFSIYLTVKDQYIKEIESLVLRITRPTGNKVTGKPVGSRDMLPRVKRAVSEKHKREDRDLFGRDARRLPTAYRAKSAAKNVSILRFLPNGARLRGENKGTKFQASVRKDGRVWYEGKSYGSLSLAAAAAMKRPMNGWWFWKVERSRGNWVRLTEIRKAGTPIYRR